MKTTVRLLLLPMVICALAESGLCAPAQSGRIAPGASKARAVSISALKGAQRVELLGKPVALEGYYDDESVPILLRSPNLACTNTILPPDSYVVLKSKLPATVKPGDRVTLSGTVRQPSGSDPAWTQGQTVLLDTAPGSRVIGRAAPLPLATVSGQRPSPGPTLMDAGPVRGTSSGPTPSKYAVLIWSGVSTHGVWRMRHQNEMLAMYRVLRSRGYADSAIFALWGPASTYSEYTGQHRASTRRAVSVMFDQLARLMTDDKQLVVYATGCGGGFYAHQMGVEDPSGVYAGVRDENGDEAHEATYETAYQLDLNGDGDQGDLVNFDEVIDLADGDSITDDELAAEYAKIQHYRRIITVMQQSFAGGFAHDLAGPNRIFLGACAEKQFSWARGPSSIMSEFTSNLVGVITDPRSVGLPHVRVNCWAPLYNYTRWLDRRYPHEIACYDDDGVPPPHSGQLPLEGEGILGATTPI